MLVEIGVQSLGLDRTNNNPVVILKEKDGERVLPIWIGPGEASAIAMQLADWSFSRPLTHDLLVSVLGGLGGTLERVLITEVVENTYFAQLIIHRNGGVFSVDARPSDCIAVALRTKAKIFAEEGLLEQATVEISEEESVTLGSDEFQEPKTQEVKAEDLKDYLRKLNPEDFGRFSPCSQHVPSPLNAEDLPSFLLPRPHSLGSSPHSLGSSPRTGGGNSLSSRRGTSRE